MTVFKDASTQEVDQALKDAQQAFLLYKNFDGKRKAAFLRAIATEIEALGDPLIKTAMEETNLPEARIISERGRTTGHCRMFADLVEEGSYVDARIDTALPDRTPLPRADIRKMSVAVGPIVVFGAANFPLAYSTMGGDSASALAAGCPVIVKAHPAHARTSALVAEAVFKAMLNTGIPKGVFQHLHGNGFEVGKALVTHPFTKGVGFTGSFAGGKALFDLANGRPEPIPVFAEMSSVNPVILLPETLKRDAEKTAEKLAASITLGVGQFCTNPGLIFAVEGDGLNNFISELDKRIAAAVPAKMLHQGIADNYHKKLADALAQKGVKVEGQSTSDGDNTQGRALVASVDAAEYFKNPRLAEEVFGPFSLIVRCKDANVLNAVVNTTHGQLTASVIADEAEVSNYKDLMNVLIEKAGRLIINGVPTGVEVCPAMHHGGPFPSTTDSRFTAVGTDAVKRFIRPVSFQSFPESLLPAELQTSNPRNIWRLFNGEWKK
jgi:NADP-dependent aldehyde dehydrogenase